MKTTEKSEISPSPVANRGLILLGLLLCPSIVWANVGLPMLAVVWPLSVPAFIPVVALESYVLGKTSGLGWRKMFGDVVRANLLSTALGIPIGWIALVALEFLLAEGLKSSGVSTSYPPHELPEWMRILLMAPWLWPLRNGGEWIVPLATMALLVPFCIISYWCEAFYLLRCSPLAGGQGAKRAVWLANLMSYTMLMAACLVWLGLGVLK